MLRAIERGLSLQDFESLTLNMILDFIISYNNSHLDGDEENKEATRPATQASFDRF